jgi:hypothetical protein
MYKASRLLSACLAAALSVAMPCIACAEEQPSDATTPETHSIVTSDARTDATVSEESTGGTSDQMDAQTSTATASETQSAGSKAAESSNATSSDESAPSPESPSAAAESSAGTGEKDAAATSNPVTNNNALPADGVYTIGTKLDASKDVDIPGASSAPGAASQIYSNNQTPAQRFSFVKGSDGSYTIRNVSSNLVLDVAGAVAKNGTRVQQYKANGTDAQKWELVRNDDGSWGILSWLRGANGLRLALDIPYANARNGAPLWIWERNGSAAQSWLLNDTHVLDDGTYTISSGIGSKHVIDVAGNSESSGANIDSYEENGTMAQRFGVFYDGGSGYYTIVNTGTGRVLDVRGASTARGANVQQYQSNGTYAQRWSFVKRQDGTWEIVNARSGLALDVAAASLANGANIWQWTRNGSAAQSWTLALVDPIASGRYVIVPSSNRSFAIDARGGSTFEGTPVQIYSRNGTDAQVYEISPSSEAGYYVIRNAKSGKYLTVDAASSASNGATVALSAPEGPADWQLWKPTMTVGGITFVSKTGLVLDVYGNNTRNNTIVQGWESNGTPAQRFYLSATGTTKLGVTDFVAEIPDTKGTEHQALSSRIDGVTYVFLPAYAGDSLSLRCYRSDGGKVVYVSPSDDGAYKEVSTNFSLSLSSSDVTSGGTSWTAYVKESVFAEPTKLVIMRSANIASLFLESADKYGQGRFYVEASGDHSVGAKGKAYALVDADGDSVSGGLSQIKGRGNSTWLLDKRPYQIKLDKKASLVDGKKDNSSKKWVLLANYADPTLLRNSIVLNTALELGLSSTPQCRSVDLYYDGEYRGTYLLAEKVEVGKGRVDIEEIENESDDGADTSTLPVARSTNSYGNEFQFVSGLKSTQSSTGGYLLEMDDYYHGERSWFAVKVGGRTYHIVLKSPEDATEEQVRYISEYVQSAIDGIDETSLGSFDLDSLARTFLVEEFSKNVDYIRHSSTYMYKDAASSALISGPVWDFDLALGNDPENDCDKPNGFASEEYAFFLGNVSFRKEVLKIFNEELKPLVQKTLLGHGRQGSLASISTMASEIGASQQMNQIVWPSFRNTRYQVTPCGTYDENVDVLHNWVAQRVSWLDSYLNSSNWVA